MTTSYSSSLSTSSYSSTVDERALDDDTHEDSSKQQLSEPLMKHVQQMPSADSLSDEDSNSDMDSYDTEFFSRNRALNGKRFDLEAGFGRTMSRRKSQDAPLEQDQEQESGMPKSRGWKLVRKHLKDGTLLLDGKDRRCRTTGSVRQSIANRIQEGSNFSIKACLVWIGLYLVVSVLMYTFVLEPDWTMIDSCYFAVTTFTTLGYGDLAPSNNASIVFTCGYALVGVAFMGLFLGVLGNRVIQSHQVMVETAQAANEKQVMALFGSTSSVSSIDTSQLRDHWLDSEHSFSDTSSILDFDTIKMKENSTSFLMKRFSSSSYHGVSAGDGKLKWNRMWLMGFVTIVLVLVCGIAVRSGWGPLTTLYYVIVTSCTIGYGDLVPTTQMERFLAIIYIPLACLIMGQWLAFVANRIIEHQSSQFRKNRLQLRELTSDDLEAMDINGNGQVSWAEFLEFMLIAMEKIDYELIDDLHSYFNKLDSSNDGVLSTEDLVEASRRKMKCARRKLELSSYKQKLLASCTEARESAARNAKRARAIQWTQDMVKQTMQRFSFADPSLDEDYRQDLGRSHRHGRVLQNVHKGRLTMSERPRSRKALQQAKRTESDHLTSRPKRHEGSTRGRQRQIRPDKCTMDEDIANYQLGSEESGSDLERSDYGLSRDPLAAGGNPSSRRMDKTLPEQSKRVTAARSILRHSNYRTYGSTEARSSETLDGLEEGSSRNRTSEPTRRAHFETSRNEYLSPDG